MSADDLRKKYEMFLDTAAGEDVALPTVDVSGGPSRKELLGVLRDRFAAEPGLAAVRLTAGHTLVGTVPRERAEGAEGLRSDPGAGMLGLPGYSTYPEQLTARCRDSGCRDAQYLFEFDDENPPLCAVDPVHGPLELESN